jgi:hypothetical protein
MSALALNSSFGNGQRIDAGYDLDGLDRRRILQANRRPSELLVDDLDPFGF